MNTRKNYKDTVYRMLFKEAGAALSLYNALNKTSYTDETMLEFNTLENAIYMGMKNDLSFLITEQMYLYEQQSTYTPNMPLRNLFYAADLLQAFVKDRTLYGSRQIKFPTPHFVVFYNGQRDMPEKLELKLSDAFAVQSENPELELKVQILNINPGMNEELKEKCPILKEYVAYVEKVRSYAKILPLEEAVEQAVEDCIREDVLRDFLLKQRAEVVKMSIYEYDEERELKLIRADERELAREEERKRSEAVIKAAVEKAVEKAVGKAVGKAVEKAVEKAEREKEETIISMCKEFDCTKEEAADKLAEKCHINRAEAEEKVNRFWEE